MFEASKNEKSRKEIIASALEIESMKGVPMSIVEEMRSVKSLLSDSTPNKSKVTKKVDAEIKKMLASIKTDLENGKSKQASVKCKQLIEKVKERNNSKVKDDNVDWGNDAMVEFDIEELQAEHTRLQTEFERAKAQLERDRTNMAIASQLQTLKTKIGTNNEKLKTAIEIRKRIEMGASVEELTRYVKDTTGLAPSMEDMTLMVEKLKESRSYVNELTEQDKEINDVLSEGSQSGLYEDMSGVGEQDLFAQLFPEEAGVSSDTTKKSAKGTAADDVVDDIYSESERMIDDIESANDEYEEKLDEQKRIMDEESRELRKLLEKRKTATAAECSFIDSDIKHHKARFVSCQNRIKVLTQGRVYNDELYVAVNAARDQNDIKEIKNLIDHNMAFIRDPEKAALAIKELKERNNSELEDINTINAVIGATDIDEGSFSSGRMNEGDITTTEKNDDEFADLEKMLGMR